jgi:hypothetical protein
MIDPGGESKKRKIDSEEKEDICSICLGPMTMLVQTCTLGCGHVFHSACVQRWLLQTKTCPMCRSTNITCQHASVAHHDAETIQVLLDAQTTRIVETERREQELQDRVIALELARTESIPFHVFWNVHPLFAPGNQ